MKLRILDHTIRLRLSMSDLRELSSEGKLLKKLHFGIDKSFTYGLQKRNQSEIIALDNVSDGLVLNVKDEAIDGLFHSDNIGIYESIEQEGLDPLRISLEKDFKCLTPRSEDESDLYPNPKEHH